MRQIGHALLKQELLETLLVNALLLQLELKLGGELLAHLGVFLGLFRLLVLRTATILLESSRLLVLVICRSLW